MSNDADEVRNGDKSFLERSAQTIGDNAKGVIQATKNYSIILNDRTSAVNIFDNVAKKWFVRIDNAHKNVNFKHINVNKKITGIPDPHTAISGTTFHAAENAAWFCKQANAVLAPVAVAIDGVRVGASAYEDYKKGTVRNSLSTVSSITGGWGGGFAGANTGAALGSMILPGIGTIAGAIIGGISGGIGGAVAAETVTDVIADKAEINIEHLQCQLCQESFECRLYTDQRRELCPRCIEKMLAVLPIHDQCNQLCSECIEKLLSLLPIHDECHQFCPECIEKLLTVEQLQCQICQENFDCRIHTDQCRELCLTCIKKMLLILPVHDQCHQLCPECIKKLILLLPIHDECHQLCPECIEKLLTVEQSQCQICQENFDCRIYTDQCQELCPKCVERIRSGEITIEIVEESENLSSEGEWFDS